MPGQTVPVCVLLCLLGEIVLSLCAENFCVSTDSTGVQEMRGQETLFSIQGIPRQRGFVKASSSMLPDSRFQEIRSACAFKCWFSQEFLWNFSEKFSELFSQKSSQNYFLRTFLRSFSSTFLKTFLRNRSEKQFLKNEKFSEKFLRSENFWETRLLDTIPCRNQSHDLQHWTLHA